MAEALGPLWPAGLDVAAFDALHDQPARWLPLISRIAAEFVPPGTPVRAASGGTVLVAMLGRSQVLKLYPPLLRDHFEFEQEALRCLQQHALAVPTPRLLASGERDGWPYLLMSQLTGQALSTVWPGLAEDRKCALLQQIGELMVQVQALPPGRLALLAPEWPAFLAGQRLRCAARQLRTGLPAQLQAGLDAFLDGPLPTGPSVLLTGEFTPMNLLCEGQALSGLFDFGDGLVGPGAYDWLGPLCFMAAGHRGRCDAFLRGLGQAGNRHWRMPLLRLLLLHRYSNLQAQLAWPGWQQAPDFETLARCLWP